MTKEAAPVCGARTRAGTSCQNTLVTGCGKCPVHASQLRAAKAGGKPVPRRMKKPALKRPAFSSLPVGLVNDFEPVLMQTPDHTGTRGFLHHAYQDPASGVRTDAAQFITPIQHYEATNADFHTPLQANLHQAFGIKSGVAEINDVLRQQKAHCSPVTPETGDTSARLDNLYSPSEQDEHGQHLSGDDVLQGPDDGALGPVDFASLGDISETKGTLQEPINFNGLL